MAWSSYIATSLQATGKVVLLCIVGAVLARAGKCPAAVKRGLNELSKLCFLPALLVARVARDVDLHDVDVYW